MRQLRPQADPAAGALEPWRPAPLTAVGRVRLVMVSAVASVISPAQVAWLRPWGSGPGFEARTTRRSRPGLVVAQRPHDRLVAQHAPLERGQHDRRVLRCIPDGSFRQSTVRAAERPRTGPPQTMHFCARWPRTLRRPRCSRRWVSPVCAAGVASGTRSSPIARPPTRRRTLWCPGGGAPRADPPCPG